MTGGRSLSINDKINALKKTELFGSLPDALLRKIAGVAVSRHLSRGEVLYSEYEEASGLFVVVSGEIRSIRQAPDGREQVLSTERAGAVLAAVPVFNGGKFFSTMIADSNSDVICIEKHHVHQLCREHTEMLWNLARGLAHMVRHFAELVETLALSNVEERLARYLLTIAHERGVRVGSGCVFELTLTRAEVATRIGSVREVVSRALTHLEKTGLIHLEGRRLITVPDMHALAKFAGAERASGQAKLVSALSSQMA